MRDSGLDISATPCAKQLLKNASWRKATKTAKWVPTRRRADPAGGSGC
ncbi:hypothetical protein KIF59_21390 [Enterobacter cloacae subsp. cloacae]|nr:hypothetical protein [Enterobacter cloacae subsp. cloacae]